MFFVTSIANSTAAPAYLTDLQLHSYRKEKNKKPKNNFSWKNSIINIVVTECIRLTGEATEEEEEEEGGELRTMMMSE